MDCPTRGHLDASCQEDIRDVQVEIERTGATSDPELIERGQGPTCAKSARAKGM